MSTNTEAAIRQLTREFGSQLDREVLESVLEICGGDAQAAIAFLKVQNNDDYVDPGNSQKESIPKDYMERPKDFHLPTQGEDVGSSNPALKIKKLLLGDLPFEQHFQLAKSDYPHYAAVLMLLLHQNVELSPPTKARALAGCWAAHCWRLAEWLLTHEQHYQLPEVLKAVKILDAPRKLRGLEKRLARLEKQGTAKAKTIGLVRAAINDLKKDVPGVEGQSTSVTGSLAKRVKKWVARIDEEKLNFYALQLPKEPWQELADIVHLSPNDFSLKWFLPVCFGAAPPLESLVGQVGALTADNLGEILPRAHFPYSYLRKHFPDMPPHVKAEIAKYEKLDTLIWYYEELCSPEVDSIIGDRLDQGEAPNFSYGKLMERLLYFKMAGAPFYHKLMPVAERRLRDILLPLQPPVVVLGDASYSMDVAIRTATIIGSLLTVLTKAELKFFNVKIFEPAVLPRTAQQVLDVATATQADGLTAPAAALWHYYDKKEIVKFFLVVTDEIENEKSKGEYFAQLFYKYYNEVYPAKMVFVSFLENPSEKGRMVRSLENLGLVPLQFRLDSRRPDLTKVDTLLGLLASECDYFPIQVNFLAERLGSDAEFEKAVAGLRELPFPEDIKRNVELSLAEEAQSAENEKEKGKEKEKDKDQEPPEEFLCPITNDVMIDPVVASDGHTYERRAIEEWIQKKATSPIAGTPLQSTVVYPNYSLKSRISEWQQSRAS